MTLNHQQIPQHNHLININNTPGTSADPTNSIQAGAAPGDPRNPTLMSQFTTAASTGTGPERGDYDREQPAAHEHQPYLTINFIVATTGNCPQRSQFAPCPGALPERSHPSFARAEDLGSDGSTAAPGRPHILTLSVSVLVSIFAVLAGLAFGSFLNVCISRLPRHESVVTPRSRCPRCLTPILNRDNIPLLGWILLRGRCRSCGVRISVRYPLVEATTAALFLLCYLEFGLTLRGVAGATLCWLFLGLAVTDAETMKLPDALTFPGIALGILASSFQWNSDTAPSFSLHAAGDSLLRAAGAAALILLMRGLYWLVRRREGIGLGDAKLMAMIAAWLGLAQTGLVLFLAVICAAAYGLVLIAWGDQRGSPDGKLTLRIPLGAFLCAAGFLSLFEGESILSWYMGFFR